MAVEDKRPRVIPELEVDLHLAVGPEDHGVLLGDAILFQYEGARTRPVPAQDAVEFAVDVDGVPHPPELFFRCPISGPLMAGCAIGELRSTSCPLITQAPWLWIQVVSETDRIARVNKCVVRGPGREVPDRDVRVLISPDRSLETPVNHTSRSRVLSRYIPCANQDAHTGTGR